MVLDVGGGGLVRALDVLLGRPFDSDISEAIPS